MNHLGYKTVITINMPIKTVEQVDEAMQRNKFRNRSEAIRQLLEMGMFVERKMGVSETWTSKDIEDLKMELETGTLVDWVAALDVEKFKAIMNIFQAENEARYKKKTKSR